MVVGHRKLVQTHIRHVEQHIRRGQMTTLARQLAAFVEARLETREVYLYAIARPDPKSIIDVVKRLASLKSVTQEGILLRLD